MHSQIYDAIVVGSGMAGGAAAQQLGEAGLTVLVIEAGPALADCCANRHGTSDFDPDSHFAVQRRCYAFGPNTRGCFVNDDDHPYATPEGRPFSWIRADAVGGKSLLWAGHCYRMADEDFKAAAADGFGEVWPLTYPEIAPYYDQAERILNVGRANKSNRVGAPSYGDAMNDQAGLSEDSKIAIGGNDLVTVEGRLCAVLAGLGAELSHARVSRTPTQQDIYTACIHCGQSSGECLRPMTSRDSTLANALKTGRVTLWTQSAVRSVTMSAQGRAAGVLGVRRGSGESFEAKARVIFLCASALESTRILLNSTPYAGLRGLANSSGVLGHYLMDHVGGVVISGFYEDSQTRAPENGRARMFYIPRWQNMGRRPEGHFLRGYGYEVFTMRADHDLLPCGRTQRKLTLETNVVFGKGEDGRIIRLVAFGEMLPYFDNRVEIVPGKRDADGIPVLRIDCAHQQNEKAMAEDMAARGVALLTAAGVRVLGVQRVPWEPGLAIHEAGTCRMGANRTTSVLNAFNQCHDVPNLFITDASCFPSIGTQNPALTILALTLRACEYAIRRFRHGDL
jgi:choline dehydrogenase-like flavoprotein